MTVRIHGNNLLWISPCWEGTDLGGRLGVGEVGLVGDVEVLARHGKRVINGVGASVRANSYGTLD